MIIATSFIMSMHIIRLMIDVVIIERIKGTHAPFYRPPLPQQECEGVHPGILTLMKQCWAEEPSERPSFAEVSKALKIINKGKSVCVFIAFYVGFERILEF